MAKLSAHGLELGRIDYLTKRVACFRDGKLLVNYGDGWKLWRKCKPGVDPAEAFRRREENLREFDAACPNYADYRRLLHREFSLADRSRVHQTIGLMPTDPDGCWSELTDMGGIECDLDSMVALCRLRAIAEREAADYLARLKSAAGHVSQ